MYYHAHVYFDQTTHQSAIKLKEALIAQNFANVRVFPLVNRPVGPHPLPMFEVHFTSTELSQIKQWFEQNRGTHIVLIHEETGQDHLDHSTGATWLGEKLELDFSIFRS